MTGKVLALPLVLVAAMPALAQTALTLPARVEPDLNAAQRDELASVLDRALREQGVTPRLAPAEEPCADTTCSVERMRANGVDQAVELKVWKSVEGDIGGVSVSVVLISGARYSEGVGVTDQDPRSLGVAVAAATSGAFARLRRGPGPWLEVEGEPVGATIRVDGQIAGALPQRLKLAGGMHHVIVEAPGFESFDATITVPMNLDALKLVTVALQPAELLTSAAEMPIDRPSALNYVVAGAAGALGVWLGIGPMRTAIEHGDCARTEHGRCTATVGFDGDEILQLSVAGLLLVGGVGFALWAPLRVSVDHESAQIGIIERF